MKYLKTYEERYLSDDDIEEQFDDFTITNISVDNLSDDGGAGGWIDIEFPYEEDDYAESRSDAPPVIITHWIKYDSGPRIAFDNWYPEKMNIKLKAAIEKEIKEERIRQEAKKYNI